MSADRTYEGTALGTIGVCAHCGYACQLRRHRWTADDGIPYEDDWWEHFVLTQFTCHTAAPKRSVWEVNHDE